MTDANMIYPLICFGLATAFVGGALLAFSDFIMRSLNASSTAVATESMQMINRGVYRTIFMALFIGLVPASLLLSAYAYFSLDGTVRNSIYLASAFYIVGVFLVTGLGNVPMNTKLDKMPIGGVAAQSYWPDYFRNWTRLNHLRTAAALVSATAFLQAAIHLARTV